MAAHWLSTSAATQTCMMNAFCLGSAIFPLLLPHLLRQNVSFAIFLPQTKRGIWGEDSDILLATNTYASHANRRAFTGARQPLCVPRPAHSKEG